MVLLFGVTCTDSLPSEFSELQKKCIVLGRIYRLKSVISNHNRQVATVSDLVN